MRSDADVREVFRLLASGLSQAEVARRVGISRATVRDWARAGEAAVWARPMRRTARGSAVPCTGMCPGRERLDEQAYAYVLGQYLGDGYLSRNGPSYRLRVTCCDAYPDILRECADSMYRLAGRPVRFVPRQGCTEAYVSWSHWQCFVPHGAGRKHDRAIALEPWQKDIAIGREPGRFVRGLIHSDGCRIVNRVVVRGKAYAYPRYFFTNLSAHIRGLFVEACAGLGVATRPANRVTISVADAESVWRLDQVVGPKS
jgi:transcriptional regulator with XRE-family HTH domain